MVKKAQVGGSGTSEGREKLGRHHGHAALESVSLQLFLVVWIFWRSLIVICYNRGVLSECHKNYFKDWCLMNSQPAFML